MAEYVNDYRILNHSELVYWFDLAEDRNDHVPIWIMNPEGRTNHAGFLIFEPPFG